MGLAAGGKERFDWIVGALVGFARSGSGVEGEVDADVQIALGVLFNTSGVSGRERREGGKREAEEETNADRFGFFRSFYRSSDSPRIASGLLCKFDPT